MLRKTAIILLSGIIWLGIAAPASGGQGFASDKASSVTGIQAEIDRLLVFYTPDHPDVQILYRHLARAKYLQAQKKRQDALQRQWDAEERRKKDQARH